MLILPITDMYKNLIFLEKKKSIGKKELNLYIRFSLIESLKNYFEVVGFQMTFIFSNIFAKLLDGCDIF